MHTVDFYYMPESPPCRLVEMVAELVGVNLKKHYVNLFLGDHMKEDFVKLNPRHKVPFIVDGNVKLSESRAIICYLVNKYMPDNKSFYPADAAKRAAIDEILYIDAGSLYQSSSVLFYPLVKGKAKKLDPESEKAFLENVGMLDERLKAHGKKYMTGDEITIGDVSIAVSFHLSQACDYQLPDDFKHIKAFLEQVKASIPRYAEITDEPMNNMRKYIKSQLEA